MGTDVYLEWESKAEELKVTQGKVFDWDIGYLRASIHMTAENGVLRMLFPEKYWAKRSRDAYDFKGNFEILECIGLKYLVGAATGKQMKLPEPVKGILKRQEETAAVIMGAMRQVVDKSDKASIGIGTIEDFGDALEWLASVVRFFELGMEKQEKGLKPYPYISW